MLVYVDALPNSYITLEKTLIGKITGLKLNAVYAVYILHIFN